MNAGLFAHAVPSMMLEPGSRALLAIDVISTVRRGQIYGKAGEQVTIISYSALVYIVEGQKGRFSVHESKICNPPSTP